jgi:hypothetical protein
LGSAKFLLGKLTGLYGEKKHLKDLVNSKWGKGQGDTKKLYAAWGLFRGAGDFNDRVLPASLEPDAGVKADTLPTTEAVEFVTLNGVGVADGLLNQAVPLVVGVDLPGGYARDHFIVVLKDTAGSAWAVDSWDSSNAASVAKLPAGFTFAKGATVEMNAGTTTIPCKPAWFGHYREQKSQKPLALKISL